MALSEPRSTYYRLFGQPEEGLAVVKGFLLASVVNLDGPGRYLHWSIFTVSEANLALIVVMVVIFGAALMIPFPGRRHDHESTVAPGSAGEAPARATAEMGPHDLGDDAD